jgi:hypothetical protein
MAPGRRARLATTLALALAVLTPTAANVVGARAGTPGPAERPAAVFLVPVRPHGFRAPASGPRPDPAQIARRAARLERWTNTLVRVPRTLPAFAEPRPGSAQVGVVPGGSKYYGFSLVAWVEERSPDGRWGRVELPYVWPRREGWIRLVGLDVRITRIRVEVDLSRHLVTVTRLGEVLFRTPGATGAPESPTPVGDYFVTDRVAFSGGALGTFAFGISGIQPRLPAGWSGGNQLAIHGTNQPSSIGTNASAGCVRVSEAALAKLKPLLAYGTPVVIHP